MKTRCKWSQSSPLMQAYHDEEWGVPEYDSKKLWGKLMLDGFQAGLSWNTILVKREAFRNAFKDFDPARVARFDEKDIERLMTDAGIVRSKAKIESTIVGAKIFMQMQKAGEDFAEYVWGLAGGKPIASETDEIQAKTLLSEKISADLKKRGFKFVGPVIVYAWMQAVGIVNDHHSGCFRREECWKRSKTH